MSTFFGIFGDVRPRGTAGSLRASPKGPVHRLGAMRDTRVRRSAFVVVGYTLVVLLAGSNLPTPLYPTYQRVFSLSPFVVTLVYSTYAVTVMLCLVVFGSLSASWPSVSAWCLLSRGSAMSS